METDYEYVLRKLRERSVSLPQIRKDTGLTVSWLSKVARGLTDDPGFKRVSKLADYFRLLERHAAERAALQKGQKAAA
jgi:transcriptional regulator with XRE-family HTH domain